MAYRYTYFDRSRRFLFRDLPNFFKNIWRFRKALWNHHWWDYSGTLDFIEIGVEDIAKNLEKKGNEVQVSRMKKVAKMKRLVEIIKNIREDRYFDIVEVEMGRGILSTGFEFKESDIHPDYFELEDGNSEEEKEFNNKYFSRVRELEELEWKELWEIVRGQDYEKFDAKEDWNSQFDGTGMRGWWD
jgi:hypothetical protein